MRMSRAQDAPERPVSAAGALLPDAGSTAPRTLARARPPRRRALSAQDYKALGAFRSALRRFLAFSEAGAKALGLTPQQHQALLAVRAHTGQSPISVGELADSLLVKNHSALGLVYRLVERGLITRSVASHDRRRAALKLTEAGAIALETISRNNLGKLKTSVPVFVELMAALGELDLPSTRRGLPAPGQARPSDSEA